MVCSELTDALLRQPTIWFYWCLHSQTACDFNSVELTAIECFLLRVPLHVATSARVCVAVVRLQDWDVFASMANSELGAEPARPKPDSASVAAARWRPSKRSDDKKIVRRGKQQHAKQE